MPLPTPAPTARTRRRYATGSGRTDGVLVVNAGSSSLKLSLLDDEASRLPRTNLPVSRGQFEPAAVASVLGRHRRGHADAVGHRVVHGGRSSWGRSSWTPRCGRNWTLSSTGAAARAQVAGGHRRGQPGAARRPRGGLLRHRLSRRDARPRRRLTRCRRNGGSGGSSALRVPRASLRLRDAAHRLSCSGTSPRRLRGPATSARVHRSPRSATAARSTPRWASRRWRAWSWPPAPARSTPGLVLWLAEHAHTPPAELAATLEYRSGLLGLAGTPDMREVLTRAGGATSAAGWPWRSICTGSGA